MSPFTGAFLAGAFYMFSGSFTWFLNLEQYANNAMMLPVLVYGPLSGSLRKGEAASVALRRHFHRPRVLLAGQPEVALYVLFLGGTYFALLRNSYAP